MAFNLLLCTTSVWRTGVHADAHANADRIKKSLFNDSTAVCIFFFRCVCWIEEGSLEDETVLWSLCKKGMWQLYSSHGPRHIFILSHICCTIYTHRMSMPFLVLRPIYISLYGHLHRAPLFLVTLHLGCSLPWRWLGGMLLGSGPQRLHCPDAAGFPMLPSLQPEGTLRSHFWSVLLHLGCSKQQGTHEHTDTHACTQSWQTLRSSTAETRMVWFLQVHIFLKFVWHFVNMRQYYLDHFLYVELPCYILYTVSPKQTLFSIQCILHLFELFKVSVYGQFRFVFYE